MRKRDAGETRQWTLIGGILVAVSLIWAERVAGRHAAAAPTPLRRRADDAGLWDDAADVYRGLHPPGFPEPAFDSDGLIFSSFLSGIGFSKNIWSYYMLHHFVPLILQWYKIMETKYFPLMGSWKKRNCLNQFYCFSSFSYFLL